MRTCLILLLFVAQAPATAQEKLALPRVVLIGDSIRLGYAPHVAKLLADRAEVISPPGAGDSQWLLGSLDSLVLKHKPDLVHFNVGLHDLRLARAGKTYQIPVEDYARNLETLARKLKASGALVLFATTTPVDDERGEKRGGAFVRLDRDVQRYNQAALRVMREQGVTVHDLDAIVRSNIPSSLLVRDGTHFTVAGQQLQARAVADCILRHLAVRAARPGKLPMADATATPAYQNNEKARDALVPPIYKKLPFGEFRPPATAEEWSKRRPDVHKIVVGSLGELPDRPKPGATLISREIHAHFNLESLTIANGIGEDMTALLLLPHGGKKPAPTILWLHSSSYDGNQLLMGGYNGGEEPLGETFTKAGYMVFAPDACWYGGRAGKGPGPGEMARAQQESLHKLHLWFGRTLWGMFVHDDQCALDYLCSRPEVDVKRIGATGISMGSTRAWWLAAIDERIACVVGVACLTRYQNLIAHGQLRQHGVYYFANGLLRHFDSEGVVALIAPRPFLALNGELDAGSPADGIREIERRVARVYAALGTTDRFRSVLYPDTGHVYTPEMRKEMLAWFARWLK